MVAILVVVWAVTRLAPPRTLAPAGVFDVAVWAVLGGVLAGRAAALALDDPSGLTRLSDVVVLRGGVEFWPGVAAGVAVLAVTAGRAGVDILGRLAVGVAVLAAGVRRLGARSPAGALVAAIPALAAVRWVAAFWLPRIGDGPTRQQVASLVVALVAAAAAVVMRLTRGRRAEPALPRGSG